MCNDTIILVRILIDVSYRVVKDDNIEVAHTLIKMQVKRKEKSIVGKLLDSKYAYYNYNY